MLAVPPILTNTYSGVDEVDRDIVEAARGMGMTERQILRRVELPLGLAADLRRVFAWPRSSSIATATIAAIAGGGGLGDDHRQPGELRARGRRRRPSLCGARRCAFVAPAGAARARCSAAAVATELVSGPDEPRKVERSGVNDGGGTLFRKHTRRAAKAAFAISFGVAIMLGGTASRSAADRVGDADGHRRHEELHRAVRARGAVQAGARGEGLQGLYKENIGSSELIHKALKSGKIKFYPEYSGVIARRPSQKTSGAEDRRGDVLDGEEVRGSAGNTVLPMTPFYDFDSFGDAHVDREEVRPQVDRGHEEGQVVLFAGVPGVQDAHDRAARAEEEVRRHETKFVPLAGRSASTSCSTEARSRRVTCSRPIRSSRARSTRPDGPEAHLRLPERRPVVSKKLARRTGRSSHRRSTRSSAKLTLKAMIAMNKAVAIDKKSPEDVASAFFTANKLK